MKTKILCMTISAFLALNAFAANVGIIDTKGKFSDIDKVIGMVKALGNKASVLPEEKIVRPTGLSHFDCIILSHRNGTLTEDEYKALAEYVEDGGTLLITGLAAYWMKYPEKDKKHRRIGGRGPLKKVTGVNITGAKEIKILKMKTIQKNPLTEGLPENFKLKKDSRKRKISRGLGVFPIKAETATVLVEAETLDAEGNVSTRNLLIENLYGDGKCIWFACRLAPLFQELKDKNITKIFSNILKDSESIK
jgi:hypothetical protein